MPKLNSIRISKRVAGAWRHADVDMLVNASGLFYCNIPAETKDYFDIGGDYQGASVKARNRSADPQLFADTLQKLKLALETAFAVCWSPEITEEKVILFNIISHVSFWEKSDGEIVPNGYYAPGTASDRDGQWGGGNSARYGDHHSNNRSRDGYSLVVGAKAQLKRTETLGKKKMVTYSEYNGGDTHLGGEHPAARLNGWCSFDLGKSPRQMAYTDEAAVFFYNMMLGMAELSRRIQSFSFDDDSLMALIDSGAQPMLPIR